MQSRSLQLALSWFLTLALGSLASCPGDPAVPLSALERVRIDLDRERASQSAPGVPLWARQGTWVLTDVRDARTSDLGRPLEIPIARPGKQRLALGFALTGGRDGERDADVIRFEVRVESARRDEIVAHGEARILDARHAWQPLVVELDRAPDEDVRLVLSAHDPAPVRAASATPPLRCAWSTPSVARGPRPAHNVLIVSVDTLRADHVGCYGYARPTTPHVDRLAARGVLFENVVSAAPWTLPSYGTLFTGWLPARHRAGISTDRERRYGEDVDVEPGTRENLSASAATLAERASAAGYATAGFVSNPFLDAATGVDRGFSRWVQYVNHAAAGVELAERWIDECAGAPWLVFVHFMDPHAPYTPPPPFDERFAGCKVGDVPGYPPAPDDLHRKPPSEEERRRLVGFYDGEIAYTDDEIGRLLDFLETRGLAEDTLVVFHSDHGEEFWDHGAYEHGHTFYGELSHVPWIMAWNGHLPRGVRITQRTSSADIAPTLLALLDLAPFADADGRSVLTLCNGGTLEPRDVVSEALLVGARERKSWIAGDLQLVTDGSHHDELYDLSRDPRETANVAASRPGDVKSLAARLRDRARRIGATATAGSALEFTEDQRRRLRAFGYPGDAK